MISITTNPVLSLESILLGSNLEDPFNWLIPLHHYFISLAENDIKKKSIALRIPPVLRLVPTPEGIITAATSLGITHRSRTVTLCMERPRAWATELNLETTCRRQLVTNEGYLGPPRRPLSWPIYSGKDFLVHPLHPGDQKGE